MPHFLKHANVDHRPDITSVVAPTYETVDTDDIIQVSGSTTITLHTPAETKYITIDQISGTSTITGTGYSGSLPSGATYLMLWTGSAWKALIAGGISPVDVSANTAYRLVGHVELAAVGAVSGVCPLGSDSLIPTAYLPQLAITTTYVAADEPAQLALTVQEGDVCVRTDENKSYIALNADNLDMGDWQELLTPGAATFLGLTDTPSSYNDGRLLIQGASSITDHASLYWDSTYSTFHSSNIDVEQLISPTLTFFSSQPTASDRYLQIANAAGGIVGDVDTNMDNAYFTAASPTSPGYSAGSFFFQAGSGILAADHGDFVVVSPADGVTPLFTVIGETGHIKLGEFAGTVNEISTDSGMTGPSNNRLVTQLAISSYVGTVISTHAGVTYAHDDISTNSDHRTTTSGNPHSVTLAELSIDNVTNDAQLKRAADDFIAFSEKAVPVVGDKILIEDSEAAGVKKYIQINNLPGSGAPTWGVITGTLSNQTDLQSALDGKSATTHNHAGTYEPADGAIQTHITATSGNPHQVAATEITDFDTEVENNADVTSNTSHTAGDGSDHADVAQNTSDVATKASLAQAKKYAIIFG